MLPQRVTRRPARLRSLIVAVVLAGTLAPAPARAIPAFARRYEVSCRTCHAERFPRLNAYGRLFRDEGYQLPGGADEIARARRTVEPGTLLERLDIFKEVPFSLRGQVFGVFSVDPKVPDRNPFDTRVFAYLSGGGSVARDVSFFFTWTPYPATQLHQARIGVHNLASGWLGEGALNVRAGAFFLLDHQRPDHRAISPILQSATNVTVGANSFSLESTMLGLEAYGRPGLGPLFYQLAIASGDPGPSGALADRDGWKDGFARLSYDLFQGSDHELTLGVFGYLGRSDIKGTFSGLTLAQRDDFWIAGGDVETELGPLGLSVTGYASRHGDPGTSGQPVSFGALRAELSASLFDDWVAEVRYDEVASDEASVRRRGVLAMINYLIATDVSFVVAGRGDLLDTSKSSVVLELDVVL